MNDKWLKTEHIIKEAAEETIGIDNRKRKWKEWGTEEMINEIDERRK